MLLIFYDEINKTYIPVNWISLAIISYSFDDFKGSIMIRRTAIPSMLVNFSTFEFLLNFSLMK